MLPSASIARLPDLHADQVARWVILGAAVKSTFDDEMWKLGPLEAADVEADLAEAQVRFLEAGSCVHDIVIEYSRDFICVSIPQARCACHSSRLPDAMVDDGVVSREYRIPVSLA